MKTAEERLEICESLLGRPDYSCAGARLYNTDCLKAMKQMKESCIDLTITSPPYNIGKEYEEQLELEQYLQWCGSWISEIYRLTSANGAFWLNLGYVERPGKAKAIPLPYLLWERVPFFMMQEIVWNYGAGVAARTSFSPRNEKFLWYVRDPEHYTFNLDEIRDPDVKYPNQKKNGKLKCNPLGKNPSDVWNFPKVTSGTDRASVERTPHPAQFPIAVIDRIVRACSNSGDLLLDPFMGSGTTAVVALSLNRPVIGFEIADKYLQIAIQRIESFLKHREAAESQGALFAVADC
jgi:adenine-specific DNA-methyltransferase